ncbi:MAG: type II toxin-antitoxin system VapC family toxin [Bacteroidia bacterium]|nr:type II toxin-antitoxin system VapC family toxin [Bacteroidia bacterium]
MRYLIDTNILVFWLAGEDFIDRDIEDIFSDGNNVIYISSLSIFETLNLFHNQRIKTKYKTIEQLLDAITNEYYLQVLHTKSEHINTYAHLPLVKNHNDPVDKIIISQAITEKMPLISSDTKFKEYPRLDFIFNRKS